MCVGYFWPWCRRELGSLCFIPGASASSSTQALPAVVLTSREACQKTYVIKWIHSQWHFLFLLHNCMEWVFSIDLHAVFCFSLSFLGKSHKINQRDLCTQTTITDLSTAFRYLDSNLQQKYIFIWNMNVKVCHSKQEENLK